MLTLEDLSGRTPEQVFDRGRVTIGRHPDNTVVLEAHTMVSGHHARITEENGEWVLEDLESTNGTFCNGLRTRAGTRTVLKSGDVIQFGTHGPMFKVSFSAGAIPAVRLRHLSPGHRGMIEVLPGGRTTIGSGDQADIRLIPPGLPPLSPVHARFSVTPSRVMVEDLSGGQGLLVNGRPVQRADLNHRDRVMFGPGGAEVEVEILAVPTTEATVGYLLPEREAARPGAVSEGRSEPERTDAVHGPPEDVAGVSAPRRSYSSEGTWEEASRPPDRPRAPAGPPPGATAGDVPPARSARRAETIGARFESWRARVRGKETSSGEVAAKDKEPSRRSLTLHVVVLLVLLVITCILGIAVSISLTRRTADAAVVVSTSVRYLAPGDAAPVMENDPETVFRQDLDSVLVEMGVARRHVGEEEAGAIWGYLEETRAKAPFRRAASYLPEIRRVLATYDIPSPFMYLPWVESRFDPGVRSSAGAVGLWQFVAHTGRRYRMRTSSDAADQRRDWVRETVAAAEYLKTLLDLDVPGWDPLLALAAYNRGEDKIIADLETLRALDGPPSPPNADAESVYWSLRRHDILPEETRQYVPRFLAAAIYFVFPEHYR